MSIAPLSYTQPDNVVSAFRDHWGGLLALGIAFVLLGAIGLAGSVLMTIVSVVLFGALLIAGAVLQVIETFRAAQWRARWPHLLLAVLYAAGGVIMLLDPLDASVALTLVLAVLLLAAGLMRTVFAFQLRPSKGWGWALAAGIGSALLGTVILVAWPQAGLWMIGLLVSVELIVNGWLCVVIALAARARDVNAGRTTS